MDSDTNGTAGIQASEWIASQAFSGEDGQLRFTGGILSGDWMADFEIKIVGALIGTDVIFQPVLAGPEECQTTCSGWVIYSTRRASLISASRFSTTYL